MLIQSVHKQNAHISDNFTLVWTVNVECAPLLVCWPSGAGTSIIIKHARRLASVRLNDLLLPPWLAQIASHLLLLPHLAAAALRRSNYRPQLKSRRDLVNFPRRKFRICGARTRWSHCSWARGAATHGLETNLNRSSCQIQDRARTVASIQAKQLKFLRSRPPAVIADYGFYIGALWERDLNGRAATAERTLVRKVYHLFYCLEGRSAWLYQVHAAI